MSVEDYIREKFNSGAELVYATARVTLSDEVANCDFLKIDTDGFDLQVLHGAERLIDRVRPLVIISEAGFAGNADLGDNTVAGVDAFLQAKGYSWVNLEVQRYTRAALPGRFKYGIPAGTFEGPLGFADLTHVDDPLSQPGKLETWIAQGLGRCFKLLALYDVIGLPDCAAELIVALSQHPVSASKADWAAMLRVLDPDYESRMNRFRADYTTFY